ncbi:MAG: hypothetical protein OEV44_14795 [Spirochaetota bacterium]|nr:hypothetical protein [Spirochaetota bacterium]
MTNDLIELLKESLLVLDKAKNILEYSFTSCASIGIKEEYTYEELDKFEALNSRFARLSDILIKKIFRLIFQIELEPEGTVRDLINKAEQKELIEKSEIFIEIRILRNSISHEYILSNLQTIFQQVLLYTPELLKGAEKAKKYSNKFINNN